MKKNFGEMKNGKAPGTSDFQIEMIKVPYAEGEEWMLQLLRAIWEKEVMPTDWGENQMVYLFKQKGDIMECGNYMGIKLTERGLKVLERMLDERLREIIRIGKQQYELMRGRGDDRCHFYSEVTSGKEAGESHKLFGRLLTWRRPR